MFLSRWTASAEFIILDRIGSVNQTLVERVPGNMPPNGPGTEALNSNDFQQGFAGGPRVGLIRHGDDGYDWNYRIFRSTVGAAAEVYIRLTHRTGNG